MSNRQDELDAFESFLKALSLPHTWNGKKTYEHRTRGNDPPDFVWLDVFGNHPEAAEGWPTRDNPKRVGVEITKPSKHLPLHDPDKVFEENSIRIVERAKRTHVSKNAEGQRVARMRHKVFDSHYPGKDEVFETPPPPVDGFLGVHVCVRFNARRLSPKHDQRRIAEKLVQIVEACWPPLDRSNPLSVKIDSPEILGIIGIDTEEGSGLCELKELHEGATVIRNVRLSAHNIIAWQCGRSAWARHIHVEHIQAVVDAKTEAKKEFTVPCDEKWLLIDSHNRLWTQGDLTSELLEHPYKTNLFDRLFIMVAGPTVIELRIDRCETG